MGMIHISCLKEWVNSKRLVYKGKKVQSFFWKALECELCKEPFENRMKYRMFQIMKFDLPNDENDYIILESIKSAPAKVIHVFDLKSCDGNKSVDGLVFNPKNEFSENIFNLFLNPNSYLFDYGIRILKNEISDIGTYSSILYAISF